MKYLFSLILTLGFSLAFGNGRDVKLSKTVEQSFAVEHNVKLEITNKYGDVVVQTWEHDSVHMVMTVTSYGKDEKAAEKQMDRVDFDFSQVGKFLIAETVFDRSRGFLRDLWNDLGDYSKTLISKSKLNIEYQIYVPAYTNVLINNKFGDVFIGDVNGKVTVDLANGNMKAGKLAKNSELNLNYGKASIKSIKDSYVKLRSVDMEVDKVVILNLKSSSSSVIISEASQLKIDSRADKFKIGEVEKFSCTSSFTKIGMTTLMKALDVDMKYGSLNIEQVVWDFEDIHFKGNSTDVGFTFSDESYIEADITAKAHKLSIPPNDLEEQRLDDKDKYIWLKGGFGKKIGNKASALSLRADDGEVIIRFTQTDKMSISN